jgi:hypothetical protein
MSSKAGRVFVSVFCFINCVHTMLGYIAARELDNITSL